MFKSLLANPPQHAAIGILGRLLFTVIFFLSGITHFTALDGYVELMPEGIPARTFWVMLSGLVEMLGAAMILLNRNAKIGGWLLVGFLVPVTIVVHGYQMVHAEDDVMHAIQMSFFLKGMAMTGAALLITQLGVRKS